MLNPGFRLLDPESEPLERLGTLAASASVNPQAWREKILNADPNFLEELLGRVVNRLSLPGIHSRHEIELTLRALAHEAGIATPEPYTFGWHNPVLERVLSKFKEPCVLLLGILDAEGIWAGCVAGVSRGGLDFLTTFQYLWADEAELAARQTLADLGEQCRAASRRFELPAGGLFIYRDEFLAWRDRDWSREILQHFLNRATAVQQWP